MPVKIPCKTCDSGQMVRRKKYRMSAVVVFIGHLLLIPSVFGLVLALLGIWLGGVGAGEAMESVQQETRSKLNAAGVPARLVEQVVRHRRISDADLNRLSYSQQETVREVERESAASTLGAGGGLAFWGGLSCFFGAVSLVSGLLGWLLVMKKRVLECAYCGAVVAAS